VAAHRAGTGARRESDAMTFRQGFSEEEKRGAPRHAAMFDGSSA